MMDLNMNSLDAMQAIDAFATSTDTMPYSFVTAWLGMTVPGVDDARSVVKKM